MKSKNRPGWVSEQPGHFVFSCVIVNGCCLLNDDFLQKTFWSQVLKPASVFSFFSTLPHLWASCCLLEEKKKKKGTQVSRNITTNDVTKSLNAYKIEKLFFYCPIFVLFDVENDGETDF